MSSNQLDLATVVVGIDTVKPYAKNPRLGNIDAIAQSLKKNKQYRPIVVQKSTNTILAGNHTWRAAKHLGWEDIAVVFVDVDDERAKRIVIADNRTADLGTYDPELLAEIMESLPDVEGTGYTEQDRQILLDAVLNNTEEAATVIDDVLTAPTLISRTPEELKRDQIREEVTSGGSVGGVSRPDFTQPEDEGLQQFDDHSSELRGVLQIREDALWPTSNKWGYPELRDDMLATEEDVPTLQTWVSKNVTPDDGMSHYLYNYNLGSSVGIPYDRTVLGFYTHDEKFEGWWASPASYLAKAINAGVKVMVVPDFSTVAGSENDWTDGGLPPIVNALNIYRSLWLGRFFQEAGIKVIPNLKGSWPYQWEMYAKYSQMPVGMPVAILQIQTFNAKDERDLRYQENVFKQVFTITKPGILYVYTGLPGERFVQRMSAKYNDGSTDVRILYSYSKIKNDQRASRERSNRAQGQTGLFTGDTRVDESDVEKLKSHMENLNVTGLEDVTEGYAPGYDDEVE